MDNTEAENSQSENNEEVKLPAPILSKKQKAIKEIKSISIILFVVLFFRSVFFEPFRIPSGSMIPTLMIGDFILVNKMAYGFKVPFSDFFSDPIYITQKENPKRGDIIVFKYPKDTSINYIKRVIALPGDTIEIKNKIVYINDQPLKTEEVPGAEIMKDMDDKFKGYNLKFYKAQTGEHTHILQQDSDNYYKVDHEKETIPPDMFFVMGDNRDFSYDSRFWKFVPHKYIKGRAILVWFSMIFPFGENDFKFRPGRIGTLLN